MFFVRWGRAAAGDLGCEAGASFLSPVTPVSNPSIVSTALLLLQNIAQYCKLFSSFSRPPPLGESDLIIQLPTLSPVFLLPLTYRPLPLHILMCPRD